MVCTTLRLNRFILLVTEVFGKTVNQVLLSFELNMKPNVRVTVLMQFKPGESPFETTEVIRAIPNR